MIKAQDFNLFSRLYGLKEGAYILRLWNTKQKESLFEFVAVSKQGAYFCTYRDSDLYDCECIWLVNMHDLPVEYIEEKGNLISLQNLKIGVVENG